MRPALYAAIAIAALSHTATAQNEAALRAAFEGRTVTVKLDMPATSQGIDIFPQDGAPLDVRELAERLKDHGTALRIGQQVMITKVVVKRTSHIEFQLGSGGYGTFGDAMANGSDVSTTSAGESREEKALRDSIKHAPGPTKRKQFERELDNVRQTRERENSRAAAEAAQANAAREANLRVKSAESGSRFNIRYRNGIPPEGLTPDGVMRALAAYVTFQDVAGAVVASGASMPVRSAALASSGAVASPAATPPAATGLSALRKGLSLKEVEALLGPATKASETREGSLTVMKRSYTHDGMKVAATFVSGVLTDFTITPQ